MKRFQAICIAFILLATFVFGRGSWLTSTTVNGRTRPVSAGLDEARLEVTSTDGMLLRSPGILNESDGRRVFNLVVSYWGYPDGDNDGNSQAANESEWSTQDKIEKVITFFAAGLYEATEGRHLLGDVRIFRGGKRHTKCDIKWTEYAEEYAFSADDTIKRANGKINLGDIHEDIRPLEKVEEAGFSLVHEAGHYLYGLGDEYLGTNFNLLAKHLCVKYSIMNNVAPTEAALYQDYR